MQILLAEYPRDSWESHPGFKEKTRQWLGAHRMFEHLAATVRKDAESYLDGNEDREDYIDKLSYRGGTLVGNLHGHHSWEDHSYFPELSKADSRFDAGLAILEKDHAVLYDVLDHFTEVGNRVITFSGTNDAKVRDDVGQLHAASETIQS